MFFAYAIQFDLKTERYFTQIINYLLKYSNSLVVLKVTFLNKESTQDNAED